MGSKKDKHKDHKNKNNNKNRDKARARGKKRIFVAPIYAVAVTWLVLTLLFPPYNIGRVILFTLASVIAYLSVQTFEKQRYGDTVGAGDEAGSESGSEAGSGSGFEQVVAEEEQRATQAKADTPEIREIMSEGQRAQKELGRLYASIPDATVKRKIRDIMEISDKIIQDAREDPTDVPQIKKFLDYYLPTTIKLLNVYDRMGQQGIEGENISGTMTKIEDMLDTAIQSYRKLLDGLFANQAMDIETDIAVMNTMLKREGLAGDDPFATARSI